MSVLLAPPLHPEAEKRARDFYEVFVGYLWSTYGVRSSRGVSSEDELG